MHSEQFVQIPEMYNRRKLNALYREIPMQDAAFRMLRKYFNAAANLYGVIPVRKLYEIFQDQNPGKISRDQFLKFSEIARHECEDYYILGDDELYADGRMTSLMDREIIDVSLLDTDFERYLQLKELQRGKKYHLPQKSEFLSYNDPFYCVPSDSVSGIKQYLHEYFHLSEDQGNEIYCELVYGVRCLNSTPTNAINRLSELGIDFKSETDLKSFLTVYMQFHDHMRMQCNRGYTPAEMRSMASTDNLSPEFVLSGGTLRKALKEEGMDTDTLRREIFRMNLPSEELRMQLLKELVDITSHMNPVKKQVKIGRNDPCPCGSGKKYKKCCGR